MHHTPTALRQIDPRTLGITWSDGRESRYAVRDLRLACRCAQCVHEMSGESLLNPQTVPADIHPLQVRPVGNYALHIIWSDGHSTGIYRFDLLRQLCQGSLPMEGT
ncbi:MAG: DUF971 domain-containing protein [Deltaproteobacteria bacterium]|nr:DUF971 domain-containing protein [Deltaproteobacteria bacterium]